MNIRAQGRLLAKYELVTPNSLRDGAIQKSITPGCSFQQENQTKPHELQILTHIPTYPRPNRMRFSARVENFKVNFQPGRNFLGNECGN